MQRAGPLTGLRSLVSEFGIPLEDVLSGLSVEPDDLIPDKFLPFSDVLEILDRASRLTGCPTLGLRLGSRFDHNILGIIGALMQTAPTLAHALEDFVSWQMGNSRAATAYLVPFGPDFFLGYGVCVGNGPGVVQIYDLGVAVACNFVRALSGGLATPETVLLGHRGVGTELEHSKVFRAPVEFSQTHTGLILTGGSIGSPNPGADRHEHRRLTTLLQTRRQVDPHSVSEQVQHILRSAVQLGDATVAPIAARLEMHPRTLERRLADEGTTFENLRNDVRRMIACQLLELSDVPIGEIGSILSYSAHSSFTHAFSRWTNMSPSAWRDQAVRRKNF